MSLYIYNFLKILLDLNLFILYIYIYIYNPAGTPVYRNGTKSFFGLKGRRSVVLDVEIQNQPVLRMRRK